MKSFFPVLGYLILRYLFSALLKVGMKLVTQYVSC
jgi:hypothetical protein